MRAALRLQRDLGLDRGGARGQRVDVFGAIWRTDVPLMFKELEPLMGAYAPRWASGDHPDDTASTRPAAFHGRARTRPPHSQARPACRRRQHPASLAGHGARLHALVARGARSGCVRVLLPCPQLADQHADGAPGLDPAALPGCECRVPDGAAHGRELSRDSLRAGTQPRDRDRREPALGQNTAGSNQAHARPRPSAGSRPRTSTSGT